MFSVADPRNRSGSLFYVVASPRSSCLSDLGMLVDTASTLSNNELDEMPAQAFERLLEKLDGENKELTRKLQGGSRQTCHCPMGLSTGNLSIITIITITEVLCHCPMGLSFRLSSDPGFRTFS